MTTVLIQSRNLGQTCTQEECHVEMKAEVGMMLLYDIEHLRLLKISYMKSLEKIISPCPQKEPNLPIPSNGTSSLQNCKTIDFYCMSHPVYGTFVMKVIASTTITT